MAAEAYLLVFNAGSSSLKFEVFGRASDLESRLAGAVSDIQGRSPSLRIGERHVERLPALDGAGDAAARVLERLFGGVGGLSLTASDVAASAHRVVHGGEAFTAPVTVTAAVLERLKALTHLAPLHNPASIAVIEAVRARLPQTRAVAVFDTAFFKDLPAAARCYAVPQEWVAGLGIKRYGFHGLAHEYIARRLRQVAVDRRAVDRAVSLHLGNGCSATALKDGRPVETSMGFTPLEGLIMGTRSGDLDPGVVLHLAQSGLSSQAIEDALNRRSGLLGLSGASGDVRELLELARKRHAGAARALAAFHHRLHKYLGAYAAVLGGMDVLAFGGGIGENSPEVREAVCAGLGWLGLKLDPAANAAAVGREGRISSAGSSIEVHVVRVDEESIIAEAAWTLLERGAVAPADER